MNKNGILKNCCHIIDCFDINNFGEESLVTKQWSYQNYIFKYKIIKSVCPETAHVTIKHNYLLNSSFLEVELFYRE